MPTSSTISMGSKKPSLTGGPMWWTRRPTMPRNMAARALSPEVATASQTSSGTPIRSIWRSTPARGRGELVTTTTAPPSAR